MPNQHIAEILKKIKEDKNNVYVWTDPALSMEMAEKSVGPLAGWGIGVKDLFCVKGTPTEAGASILEGFVAPYESTVTDRLWKAGAVFLGKQNLDSFGMGSHNTNSKHGPSLNVYQKDGQPTSPGGSSGASAVAVASGLARVSIGTDTGGSCRQPAAWTGTVGFKPTYGLVSRFGMIAHASSLDCPGIIANNIEDVAKVLRAIAGFDPNDAQTYDMPVPDFTAPIDVSKMRLASYAAGTDISEYKQPNLGGMPVSRVDISHILQYSVECYYIICSAEAFSNLQKYDGLRYGKGTTRPYKTLKEFYAKTRADGFSPETQRRLLTGAYILQNEGKLYKRASQIRRWIADQMNQMFDQYDALILPTSITTALTLDEIGSCSPADVYRSDQCTILASLIGAPAISIPIPTDGMPIGMQIVCKPGEDHKLLEIARTVQKGLCAPGRSKL